MGRGVRGEQGYYDLTTASGRCNARRHGWDVPKRRPGVRTVPFWSLVEKTSTCWLFQRIRVGGYGRYRSCGRTFRAHRWAWTEANGPIPSGAVVMHICDTPACVNPAHLRIGTHAENVADRHHKGRSASGEAVGTTRLSNLDIQTIRLFCPPLAPVDVARHFHMSASGIRKIVRGLNWKHA